MSNPDTPSHQSYTVDEFCLAERKSRSQFYNELRDGRGPRYYRNGNKIRITHQARLDYQREREAEAALERTAAPAEVA
jgi:hypothetical protein